MLKQGKSQTEIGKTIGKSKSVVSREISRNKDGRNGEYRHDLAQKKYEQRRVDTPKYIRFTSEMQVKIESLLKLDYSPEQIAGVLKKNNEDCVSPEWIYQHIWADKKNNGTLHLHLRRQGRRYRKRGNTKDNRGIITGRVGIEKRPSIVDKKERYGDLEVDLIIGKDNKEAIVTINDRATGMLKMKHVPTKEADVVAAAICELLEDWAPYIHTITSDNGKEFANHKMVAEQMNIDYYFARPYHSWERGANENLNGLVRQYIPKKSDFSVLTDEYIKEIEIKINSRPRKRYGFENPIFMMEKLLFNDKVAFVT